MTNFFVSRILTEIIRIEYTKSLLIFSQSLMGLGQELAPKYANLVAKTSKGLLPPSFLISLSKTNIS